MLYILILITITLWFTFAFHVSWDCLTSCQTQVHYVDAYLGITKEWQSRSTDGSKDGFKVREGFSPAISVNVIIYLSAEVLHHPGWQQVESKQYGKLSAVRVTQHGFKRRKASPRFFLALKLLKKRKLKLANSRYYILKICYFWIFYQRRPI